MIQLYRVERIFTMGFGSNWNLREEVLPVLLDFGTPKSSFPIYSVVFHEVGEYEMIKSGLSMKTTNDLFGCPLWGWEVNCVQIHKKTIKWSNSPTTEDNKRHIQACALSLLETSVFHVDDYYHIIIISLYHHHYQIIIIIHAGMCPLPFGDLRLPRRCGRGRCGCWTWPRWLLCEVRRPVLSRVFQSCEKLLSLFSVLSVSMLVSKKLLFFFSSLRNLTRLLYPADEEDKIKEADEKNKDDVEVELKKQFDVLYIINDVMMMVVAMSMMMKYITALYFFCHWI